MCSSIPAVTGSSSARRILGLAMLCGLLQKRQPDLEGAALPDRGIDADPAAVSADNLSGDVEPQSQSTQGRTVAALRLVEDGEELEPVLLRDARTMVHDPE